MLERFQKHLFLLVIFSLSFQVGLHFWPNFAYVLGSRVDYLSPTLYLLDVLIITWIVLCLKNGLRINNNATIPILIISLFILSLAWNVFYAKSFGAHIFGVIKLIEFSLFGFFVARTFTKKYIRPFTFTLAASGIVSSVLAIWQFVNQSSVGSLWYFLGERTFNSSTIGISTVNFDSQILRSYGAFPHPNILAFFLLIAIVFSVLRLPYEKKLTAKSFLLFASFFSSIALIFTFSRISMVLAIAFLFYAIYTKQKRNMRYVGLGILGILGLLGVIYLPSEFLLRGIDLRQELFSQSLEIFLNNPYFGIGINNFFIHQAPLVKTISPILYQPVHNIYVLALLSLGAFGWWILPAGLFLALRNLWQKIKESRSMNPVRQAQDKHELWDFYRGIAFILVFILIVGLFDHFFLTLEQGQIMLALILGLSFTKLISRSQ